MRLFVCYIRQRRRGIAVGALFCAVFVVSFILYHLPVEAVLYPGALCVLFGLILMAADYRRVKKKHEALESISSITDVLTGTFPDAKGVDDEDYQRIIRLAGEEYNQYRAKVDERYRDMVDYYTVWVHQIKTPIASMRLHLQNEDTVLSRKLSADLMRIEQYVEMVLTFLRLRSESTDYVIKEYDLDGIVKQAVKRFAGEFIGRKLQLVYEPLHTSVITDEKWLSFVLEQVLSNALKYTFSGAVTIALKPEKKLCIQDTGIGIAPEDLPRIFEKGYTGYNGRVQKRASGIGLYLCKCICTNLGHTIEAESKVGEGTVITIDFSQIKLEVE